MVHLLVVMISSIRALISKIGKNIEKCGNVNYNLKLRKYK